MSEVAQAIHSSPDGHIPQLRFPEFSGEWMTDELSNLIEISSNKFNPNTSNESKKCIELEHLSQETGELLGYTDSTAQASTKNAFTKGQVLFGKLRPYLKKFWLSQFDGVCSSEIWVLNGKKLANNYLFQFIQTNKFNQIANVSSGSKMPRSDWKYMVQVPFKYTTKPEQQKIAAFLTAVDNKIEQLSKKQALLGEYKKGLMQQIFSQAIRFHSKGTSSQAQGEIDDTPGQPLLPNGNSPSGSDFPDWEEKKLGDITDLITKGTTPTSVGYNFTTEGINFIKVESIKNFKIDIGSVPKISEECHHHLKRSQLKNNDIVFSIAGTLGRTAIVKNKDLPANTNQALSIIRLNRSQHILFVHYLLNLESIDKYIHRMLSVGAQPNLSLQQVGDIQLQLPSLLEQSKITNFLSFIDSKIEQVGKQLDESKQFKKALLQQMFI